MGAAVVSALQGIASLEVTLFLLLGIVVGLSVGLLPGLGGSTGMALLVPFLFGMDPIPGISMLVGFAAVGGTSDTFPSVLIGVPGSGGSQSLILDGHALAKRGQASRALGAAFSSSLFGGLIGAFTLLLVITAARPLVKALGTPELLMFAILGLATVGTLVRGDPLLGVLSALFGVMLGTIGGAPAFPEYRYAFDSLYLRPGLSIIVVTMGLFAVPEAISLLVHRGAIAKTEEMSGGIWDGFRETLRHKLLVLRSSMLGTAVGAVPGVGGAVANWMAYGVAKQTSRDNEEFGRGDIRGVIAPEAANNAVEGGTMIPTLVLGIPGSGTTAVMLGGLVLMGITPGPGMLEQHLDITLTVIWTLVIANVIATATCFTLSRQIAKITLVPGTLLAPFLVVLFLAAAFQSSQHFGDIIAVLVLGVLGYAMKISGWSRAPAIVGFVLAPSLERYLHLSISRYGGEWMTRPGVLSLAVVTVVVLAGAPLYRRWKSGRGSHPDRAPVAPGPTPNDEDSRARESEERLAEIHD